MDEKVLQVSCKYRSCHFLVALDSYLEDDAADRARSSRCHWQSVDKDLMPQTRIVYVIFKNPYLENILFPIAHSSRTCVPDLLKAIGVDCSAYSP